MPVAERAVSYEPIMLEAKPEPKLKTTYINNRRYLGNKYKLLPFITSVVVENCEGVNSVADIFSGTGAVASAFTDKQLITNDNLYSNYVSHLAWFSPQAYSREKIERLIAYYNEIRVVADNYMSENFADTFFSLDDCRKIGFIREDIETRFSHDEINERERALLITYHCRTERLTPIMLVTTRILTSLSSEFRLIWCISTRRTIRGNIAMLIISWRTLRGGKSRKFPA